LHVRDRRPLFAFQFGAGGFGVGAQGLDAHLHPGQGLKQLRGLSEDGQPTQQRFPVLQTATGALVEAHTQHGVEWQPAMPTPAASEAAARNVQAAAATVHRARLAPTSHGVHRVDPALRARRASRPGGAGQLAQPGAQ